MLADMYAEQGKSKYAGLDVRDGKVKDAVEAEIFDSLESKSWALKLAVDVVLTILKVD